MSDEETKNKTTLVSTGNRGLATRSSGLVKRGLELISTVQHQKFELDQQVIKKRRTKHLEENVVNRTIRLKKLLDLGAPDINIEKEMLLLQMALNDLSKYVGKLNSHDAYCYFILGKTQSKLGLYEEAVESYKKAIELKPDDAEAYCNLGLAQFKLGLYKEAIESYKQAKERHPNHADRSANPARAA